MSSDLTPTRLSIGPVIERAEQLRARVATELPTHDGLLKATKIMVEAAEKAKRVATSMKRPWSPHRLPVVFLALTLLAIAVVVYREFIYTTTLTLALPDRDAAQIRENLRGSTRLNVRVVDVPGSREGAALLEKGAVDLAFVQGGVPLPRDLLRHELPARELVLYFVRPDIKGPSQVKKVLTSTAGEGSHSVAQAFFAAWGVKVEYLHAWKELTSDATFLVPPDVDAALVAKDPGDESALVGAERLTRQGFVLTAPQLGARASRFEWLQPTSVPAGWLRVEPPVPGETLATYSVATYLVAREGLTPRLLGQAAAVADAHPRTIDEQRVTLKASDASEVLQGVDAFLSILVDLGLAFLALLGLDVIAYRKPFHELNSLVSLIAMLQSNKDVLGVAHEEQQEHLLYLGLCSDMLSIISAISGYYTQENSSLLFNNLSEVIHQRCDGLKLNIQLKLLHAMVPTGRGA